MKKLFSLLLALVLLCSTGMAATYPCVDEPITMTAFATAGPYTKGDFNDLALWRVMEELTGITMKFEAAPSGQSSEKLGLLFASNNLPEIIFKTGLSNDNVISYAEEGQLVAIDPYLEEYAPNFYAILEEKPEIRKAITMSDGHIYGFPYLVTASPSTCSPKLFINAKALEAIGKQAPTTLDELTDVLRAFKAYDYNGNGAADEIAWAADGYGQITKALYGTFGLGTRGGGSLNWDIDPESGELRFIPTSDGYRDMIAYLAGLYQEGLIDQEVFTGLIPELTAKAEQNRLLFVTAHNTTYLSTYADDYVGIEPLTLNAGDEKHWAGQTLSVGGGNTFITNKCQNPAAAVQYFDYFYSDEGIRLFFMGIEGETWETDENGKAVFTDYVKANPDGMGMEEALGTYICWSGGNNPSVANDEYFGSQLINATTVEAAQKLLAYGPETLWPGSFTYTTEEAELQAEYKLEIDTYVKDMTSRFISGAESMDSWDKYVEQINKMDLAGYTDLVQAALDRYNAL